MDGWVVTTLRWHSDFFCSKHFTTAKLDGQSFRWCTLVVPWGSLLGHSTSSRLSVQAGAKGIEVLQYVGSPSNTNRDTHTLLAASLGIWTRCKRVEWAQNKIIHTLIFSVAVRVFFFASHCSPFRTCPEGVNVTCVGHGDWRSLDRLFSDFYGCLFNWFSNYVERYLVIVECLISTQAQ